MQFRMYFACACATLSVAQALAHGPQIQIAVDTNNGNKITTHKLMLDEPYSSAQGLTAATSIYVMPVLATSSLNPAQIVGRVKPTTSNAGPGFTYGYDQTIGSTRYFAGNLNLQLGGLQVWNGSAFVPTDGEQLGVLANSSSNVNADTFTTTPAGGSGSVTINASYAADAHTSFRYTLKNGTDPAFSASDDGIYLATLQLSSTQASPSLAASNPFYFILSKNADVNTLNAVVGSFAASQGIGGSAVQFVAVPEPSSVVLAALLGLLSTRRRPRRKASA